MSAPVAVIIPVWHGAEVIGRSLGSLAAQTGALPTGISVIAAVNDGSDASIAAAEQHRAAIEGRGWRYCVIATPPGRVAAFAAAEHHCEPGARLYVDQDARLSPGALAAFCAATADPQGPGFVTFALSFTRSRSWLVRMFLTGWLQLPYITRSPVVAGVYGVSEAGHARCRAIPAGLPDDKYVRWQFALGERLRLGAESYEVIAPDTYAELLRTRARYARSNRRLARHAPDKAAADAPRLEGLAILLRQPGRLAVVALTTALAAIMARGG